MRQRPIFLFLLLSACGPSGGFYVATNEASDGARVSLTVARGSAIDIPNVIVSENGFEDEVELSTGPVALPAGVSAQLPPTVRALPGGAHFTLHVAADATAAPGPLTVEIAAQAKGGDPSLAYSTGVDITIQ